MNINSKEKSAKNIIEAIKGIDKEFDVDFETRMINYRFLSIIDEKMDELGLSKKDLAEAIGTSASYVTQLFRGDKTLNLSTLAKLQNALNVKFKISDRNTKIQITKDEIDNYIKRNLGRDFFIVYTSPERNKYDWNPSSNIGSDSKFEKYA